MMSEREGKRERRRRSIRLHRQSSVPLLPLPPTNCEDTECPEGGPPDSIDITCMNVSVFSASQIAQEDDGGSFWIEVNEDTRRTRKSRRSNIGFHVIKDVRDSYDAAESTDAASAPVLFDSSESRANMVGQSQCDSPDIEIPRLPCAEESPNFITPTTYHTLTEDRILGRSETKTPSVLSSHGYKALPCVRTPSQEIFDGFDDAFMLGTPVSSQEVDQGCPPSCEDDSEDSLLIGTPDLAKFQKNIRFRCSLDFSELDRTPVKGEDVSADVSQDSVHESPLVGFVYDKLSASDLVRRKRAKSHRCSNENTKSDYPQDRRLKNGTPRRIVDDISNNTDDQDGREVIFSSPAVDPGTTKRTLMSVGHVNVSMRSNRSTSTTSSYTSCVEDNLSQPSTHSFLLDSPAYASPSDKGMVDSPNTPAPLFEESSEDTKSTPKTHRTLDTQVTTPVTHRDPDKQVAVIPECSDTRDPFTPSPIPVSTDCMESEPIVRVSETGGDSKSNSNTAAEEAEMEQISSSHPEPKGKERSITSEVCDLFRNLAKKFSSSGKKGRKSTNLKKPKNRGRWRKREDAGTSGSSADVVSGSAEESVWFSFRKGLSEQPTPNVEKHPAEGVSKQSLDFSPFLASGQNSTSSDERAEPQSPVWKVQSSSISSRDVVVCENSACVNSPLLKETVLLEKCVNVESCEAVFDEPAQKRRGRSKRRSIETTVLQECENLSESEPEPNKEEVEETSSLRRSRRSRRSSLEIFRYQSHTPDDIVVEDPPCTSSPEEAAPEVQPKKTRSRRKAAAALEENLEDLYRNKNYKAPGERMWETLFESPDKSKKPELIMSRRKYRRSLAFEVVPPSKIKRRLQRAMSQGWDVTGRKRKIVQLEEVKMKIAALSAEIETDHEMITM